MQHILLEDELDALLKSQHRPNYVARMLAEIIKSAALTPQESWLMDANLSIFADTTGGCERIFKTPIPLSWTRESSTPLHPNQLSDLREGQGIFFRTFCPAHLHSLEI